MVTTTGRRSPLAGCMSLLCERPPPLAQTRPWHRSSDRFLERSRPLIVPVFVALGFFASVAADQMPARPALLPAAAFFTLVGGWCGLNFARCREAHCVVTGAGYSGLAVAAFAAFILDQHWTGPLWAASLAVLAVAVVFQASWAAWRGSTAIKAGRSSNPDRRQIA